MKDTLKFVAPVAVGLALGYAVSPALRSVGLSTLGAFSALLVVMLGWYFVGESQN